LGEKSIGAGGEGRGLLGYLGGGHDKE